jgi:hypothetical protein
LTPSSRSGGSSSENESLSEVCERRSAVIAPPGVNATPWRAASVYSARSSSGRFSVTHT